MMEPTAFPKLQYPLHTKELTIEQRLIVLAYDIIWRNEYAVAHTSSEKFNFAHDVAVNLMQLGSYIEHLTPVVPFEQAGPIFEEEQI